MKRTGIIKIMFIVILTCILLTISAMASGEINVTLNGDKVNFSTPPQLINGQIVVPMGELFNSIGLKINVDKLNQTVDATDGTNNVSLDLKTSVLNINGNDVTLDVPPTILDGNIYMPLRSILESLGAYVNWIEATQTVAVRTDNIETYNKFAEVPTIDCVVSCYTSFVYLDDNFYDFNESNYINNGYYDFTFTNGTENADEYIKLLTDFGYFYNAENDIYVSENSNFLVKLNCDKYRGTLKFYEKYVTLYADGDKSMDVRQSEVEENENDGWYDIPVTKIYAPDGRDMIIPTAELEAYFNVGWYDYPVTMIYAADGRQAVIRAKELDMYLNVGWYTEPFVLIYAPDGRSAYVKSDEVSTYTSLGWFTYPVVTIYASGGRSAVIPKAELNSYLKVGWHK